MRTKQSILTCVAAVLLLAGRAVAADDDAASVAPASPPLTAAAARAPGVSVLANPAVKGLHHIGLIIIGTRTLDARAAQEYLRRLLVADGHTVSVLRAANTIPDAVASVSISTTPDITTAFVEIRGQDGHLVPLGPTEADAPAVQAPGVLMPVPVATFTFLLQRVPVRAASAQKADVEAPSVAPRPEGKSALDARTQPPSTVSIGPGAKSTMRVVGALSLTLGALGTGGAVVLGSALDLGCSVYHSPQSCHGTSDLVAVPLAAVGLGLVLLLSAAIIPDAPPPAPDPVGALSLSAGILPGQGGAVLLNGRF